MKSALGFTLVELLVVISIIAILSVIGITVFTGVQKNARDAHRKLEIDGIAKAMEIHYHGDMGKYECLQNEWFSNNDPAAYRDPENETDYPRTPDFGCGKNTDCPGYPYGGTCFTSWTVCADLEADGRGTADTTASPYGDRPNKTDDYCKGNQQ